MRSLNQLRKNGNWYAMKRSLAPVPQVLGCESLNEGKVGILPPCGQPGAGNTMYFWQLLYAQRS